MKHLFVLTFFLSIIISCAGQTRDSLPCKFNYPQNYIPVCPLNHSSDIVRIVYGKPSRETIKKAERNEVFLGGCLVTSCDPKYYCLIHKVKF